MEKKTKKMAAALAVVAVVLMVAAGLLIYQGRSPLARRRQGNLPLFCKRAVA